MVALRRTAPFGSHAERLARRERRDTRMEILFRDMVSVGPIEHELAGRGILQPDVGHLPLLQRGRVLPSPVGKAELPLHGMEFGIGPHTAIGDQPGHRIGIAVKERLHARFGTFGTRSPVLPLPKQLTGGFSSVNERKRRHLAGAETGLDPTHGIDGSTRHLRYGLSRQRSGERRAPYPYTANRKKSFHRFVFRLSFY